jgi:hypothetical protein
MTNASAQAIDRAIQAVEEQPDALRTAADCALLQIGNKSIEKLQEIVTTGAYRRNQILAQDPHQQATKLVHPSVCQSLFLSLCINPAAGHQAGSPLRSSAPLHAPLHQSSSRPPKLVKPTCVS